MSSSPGGAAPARGPIAGGRVGLSEYTAQRLAELRARRAEAETTEKTSFSSTSTRQVLPGSPTASRATDTTRPGLQGSNPTNSNFSDRTFSGGGSTRQVPSSPTPTRGTAMTDGGATRPGNGDVTGLNGLKTDSASVTAAASVNNYTSNSSYSSRTDDVTSLQTQSVSIHSPQHHSRQHQQPHQYVASTSVNRSLSSTTSRQPPGTAVDVSSARQNDDECLGFASLPEQVHRKAVKRGFDFTVMVVGETGLGKSTLLRCLFLNNDLYNGRVVPSAEERIEKTIEIEKKSMEIEEKGVKLRLTIVDTPGFNDSVDARHCWKPIEDYIDNQFEQYYRDETGLNRRNIKDNRVHCCLYFIPPYGHGLRQVDIELMKSLQDRVNVVPVIAKSDTLTRREVNLLKTRILEEIEQHKIRIYEFPECDSDEDEDSKQQDSELKAAVPFAVMGSNTVVEISGRKVRGRLYPWGIVEVDNASHSDFNKLRQFIISSHMQDLKDVTRDVHYENYRARHIQQQLAESQKERKRPSKSRLKRESGSGLDAEQLLQQKEHEIEQMKAMLEAMNAQLTNNSKTTAPRSAAIR